MTKESITNELEKQYHAVARSELGDFSSENCPGEELVILWAYANLNH